MRFAAFFKIYQIIKLKFLKFNKILQNECFLAKIGADTTENEQHFAEILQTDAL